MNRAVHSSYKPEWDECSERERVCVCAWLGLRLFSAVCLLLVVLLLLASPVTFVLRPSQITSSCGWI